MKSELMYLYSILKLKDTELLEKLDVRHFFNNDRIDDLFCLAHTLQRSSVEITKDNCIKFVYQSVKYPELQNEMIGLIKRIYDHDGIPLADPYSQLKKEFQIKLVTNGQEFFANNPTENEIKEYVKTLTNDLAYSVDTKVHNLKDIMTEYHTALVEGRKPLIIKKFDISSYNLKQLFGTYVYAQKYTFTALPGGYKTTFLYEIANDMASCNQRGLLYSLEDTSGFTGIKLFAQKTGIQKEALANCDVRADQVSKKMEGYAMENLFIIDDAGEPKEIYDRIFSVLNSYGLDFVALDFYQMVETPIGWTDTMAINAMDSYVIKLIKKFSIPIFCLSQTTSGIMRDVQNGKTLGFGDEKGSSKISQTARWSYYFTPQGQDNTGLDKVLIKCGKATFGNKRGKEWFAYFDGSTGQLKEVTENEEVIQ